MLGEFVVEDEDDEALLNIEELKVDAGTGRALSLDPLEVDELPILGESKGEGVIDVDANAFDFFVSLFAHPPHENLLDHYHHRSNRPIPHPKAYRPWN